MASVHLDFLAPDQPGLESLEIYEATASDGPWGLIETVTPVGSQGAYLSAYTTNLAASATNWFRIRWQDDKGAYTSYSEPVKGGVSNLVKKLKDRVLLRDATINETVAVQEAEYVIAKFMQVEDPYDSSLAPTFEQLEGMTLWALARSKIHSSLSTSSSEGYTAGLVSQKSSSGSGTDEKLIKWLLDEAMKVLGLSGSYVFLLEDIDPTGNGTVSTISYDQSRLALTIGIE